MEKAQPDEQYDFAFIYLLDLVSTTADLDDFLRDHAQLLFASIRKLLIDNRYCAVLARTESGLGIGFPISWSIALSGRDFLRLRDEKVGIDRHSGTHYYCIVFQASDDQRPAVTMSSDSIRVAQSSKELPTWVIPKPPPWKKDEILHPAKFPETLIENFIECFTEPGENVFDPMVGTGSSVVAAVRTRRNGYGVDLEPSFVEIAQRRAADENRHDLFDEQSNYALVVQGDSKDLNSVAGLVGASFHYSITSPPYWSMLRNRGKENQKNRRRKNLPLVYSESADDLGNVHDYDQFLDILETVYEQVAARNKPGGHLTVVVKNVKRNHILYPRAWDLTSRLCAAEGRYDYVGTTFWCQDDVGLKPFAVGIHWVSNILHQYCLHYRLRSP